MEPLLLQSESVIKISHLLPKSTAANTVISELRICVGIISISLFLLVCLLPPAGIKQHCKLKTQVEARTVRGKVFKQQTESSSATYSCGPRYVWVDGPPSTYGQPNAHIIEG
ncbi:uncharacterized [Lates japonicus]